MRRRVTPSLVLSVVAIVLATTAGATAASSYITGRQIKDSSITGADVKNRSLTPADFRGSVTGPQGPAGPQGPQGAAGAAGSAGLLSVTTVDGAKVTIPAGSAAASPTAQCPTGSTVIGTGFDGPMGGVGGFVKKYGTFVGGFFVNTSSIAVDANVQAICGTLPPSATAAAARVDAGRRAYRRDLSAARRRALGTPVATTACKQAKIQGQTKCIARGQFCKRSAQKDYKRYGFSCSKRDANGRYHLQ